MNEIDIMLDYLTQLTKDEADLIEKALSWNDEDKLAFMIAKKYMDKEWE